MYLSTSGRYEAPFFVGTYSFSVCEKRGPARLESHLDKTATMNDMLNQVRGKVFIHPRTKASYGPIRFPQRPASFSTLDGTSLHAIAEDGCGNYFTMKEDGSVRFWDHETDDIISLATSVVEFMAHCIDPPPVELDPSRVTSVWIDPKFAKARGMKVPMDGWVKRPAKPKQR